jgi:hypothetical protein
LNTIENAPHTILDLNDQKLANLQPLREKLFRQKLREWASSFEPKPASNPAA